MFDDAMILTALEEMGYTDTNEGLLNRLARALNRLPGDSIDDATLRRVCIDRNIDPDSLTPSDLQKLQEKLNRL